MCHDAASGSGRPGRGQRRGRSDHRPVGGGARGCGPGDHGVVPSAADPVSLQTAAGFSAQGSEHAAVAAEGVEELGRAGVGVGESGASYAPVTRPPPRHTGRPTDNDRAGVDGFAAGGAFSVAEQRSGTGVAVGGCRGVDLAQHRICLGGSRTQLATGGGTGGGVGRARAPNNTWRTCAVSGVADAGQCQQCRCGGSARGRGGGVHRRLGRDADDGGAGRQPRHSRGAGRDEFLWDQHDSDRAQ